MDTFALIAAERLRLADVLDELSPTDWQQPSLCGAWTVHQVAAHLNVPFTVGTGAFLVAMAKALGRFDLANERLADDLALRMDPAACVAGLRTNAGHRFTPPGFGPEAPLTDTIVHGCDLLQPVGRSVEVAPEALAVALAFAATSKAQRGFGVVSLAGVRLEPDDVDVTVGDGDQVVSGPGRSILAAVLGRRPFLDDLAGPGVDVLGQRT